MIPLPKTNEERLQELLNKKDEELEKLQEKVDHFEHLEEKKRNRDTWIWTEHYILDEDDIVGLPVPRLELRWKFLDDHRYNSVCWYTIVFKHLVGEIIRVPFGMTSVSGGKGDEFHANHPDGPRIGIPFRDGSHIINEARQLKLRAFAISGDRAQELIPGEEGGGNHTRGPIIDIERL